MFAGSGGRGRRALPQLRPAPCRSRGVCRLPCPPPPRAPPPPARCPPPPCPARRRLPPPPAPPCPPRAAHRPPRAVHRPLRAAPARPAPCPPPLPALPPAARRAQGRPTLCPSWSILVQQGDRALSVGPPSTEAGPDRRAKPRQRREKLSPDGPPDALRGRDFQAFPKI